MRRTRIHKIGITGLSLMIIWWGCAPYPAYYDAWNRSGKQPYELWQFEESQPEPENLSVTNSYFEEKFQKGAALTYELPEQSEDLAYLDSYYLRSQDKQYSSNRTYIQDLRLETPGDFSRLEVALSQMTAYDAHVLQNPDRLYIDFSNTIIEPPKRSIDVHNGLVERIRAAQFNQDKARVVLDLQSLPEYKIYHRSSPERVIVEVFPQNTGRASGSFLTNFQVVERDWGSAAEDYSKTTLAQELGLKVKTIILDPGHGGHDSGACGPTGLKEKDVTLDIARRLKALLKQNSGYEVYLTREGDSYPPLESRTAFANQNQGDLFISIHTNAHPSGEKNGIETYYLSLAQDEESRAVAAYENALATMKVSEMKNLLVGIMKNSKIEESRGLAEMIQSRLVQKTGRENRGVRQAGFVVLVGATMPSILVEVGFISNPQEERLLKTNQYRQQIAEALFSGIQDYSQTLLAEAVR
ncbi:MAG: N-acetylmuramoyl-L-alanine amidase [candidate division KSB1 bacterium]|nr:N-acetylmuramoyl-L-alanine amidase [candidate division KSB1 bacterium]